MWSWVGLSRDTAESRSAPRVAAVTSSSIPDGVRCVLGRALRRLRAVEQLIGEAMEEFDLSNPKARQAYREAQKRTGKRAPALTF